MSLEIKSEYDNKLLGRKDIVGELSFTGATPKKTDVANMIAAKTSADIKLVVVKVIDTAYGEQKAKVTAFVYDSMDTMKKIEKVEEEVKEEGATEGGDAPAEEKPAEEKKEEAPAEEKKEEPVAEKKGE